MSLKTHLLIVSLIILAVFAAWKWTQVHPAASPQELFDKIASDTPPPSSEPPHAIEIIRASWGINCREGQGGNHDKGSVSSRENNVLQAVSALCNGKPACEIRVSTDVLGSDPVPGCFDKALEVEYRCFSFDRPWKARTVVKSLAIRCDQGK